MERISDEERALARRFATAIVERRMAMPAVLFLEGMRPMNFIGSQALHFFNPVLGVVFSYRDLEAIALFLEKRGSLPLVIGEIEELEEARLAGERAEKNKRKEQRRRSREDRRRAREAAGRSRWWPW